MATTEAVICVGETHVYQCRETHCEGRQVKSRQAADDKGQQNHSHSAALNGRGLQTEITLCSLGAVADQEHSEHSETTINLSFVTAISFVYGIPPNILWQIVADLRGKGKPITSETIIDKCNLYEGCYASNSTAHSQEDTCQENNGVSGVSNHLSSTLAFESLPSPVHTSEISASHYYHQLNSTTQKSPLSQSPSHNSEYLLLSLPTIPHDYHFRESKADDLYNVTEDGEDEPDGRNLESNDGLDSWLVSDFSNPVVQMSERTFENVWSPVFSQTLSGLDPHVPANLPEQNLSFHELSNGKPSVASPSPFGQVPPGRQNSVSRFSEFLSARSCADGLSSGLNAGDSISSGFNSADDISNRLKAAAAAAADGLTVSPGLPDIVCDSAEPRNTQATESKPAKKPRTLTEAELFQFTFSLLEMEHELLEQSRLCHSCHQKPREVTFLPCGHFITCADCAEPMYVCPLCEKSILATVNTFLS